MKRPTLTQQAMQLLRLAILARAAELECSYFVANHRDRLSANVIGATADLATKAKKFREEFSKHPQFQQFNFSDLTADQSEGLARFLDLFALVPDTKQQAAADEMEAVLNKYIPSWAKKT